MSICDRCGDSGAKYSPAGDRSNGIFCFNCIDIATYRLEHILSVGHDSDCNPSYSDNAGTRELYSTMMSAPNSEYK